MYWSSTSGAASAKAATHVNTRSGDVITSPPARDADGRRMSAVTRRRRGGGGSSDDVSGGEHRPTSAAAKTAAVGNGFAKSTHWI